jgi:hypothetical protein
MTHGSPSSERFWRGIGGTVRMPASYETKLANQPCGGNRKCQGLSAAGNRNQGVNLEQHNSRQTHGPSLGYLLNENPWSFAAAIVN